MVHAGGRPPKNPDDKIVSVSCYATQNELKEIETAYKKSPSYRPEKTAGRWIIETLLKFLRHHN